MIAVEHPITYISFNALTTTAFLLLGLAIKKLQFSTAQPVHLSERFKNISARYLFLFLDVPQINRQ